MRHQARARDLWSLRKLVHQDGEIQYFIGLWPKQSIIFIF